MQTKYIEVYITRTGKGFHHTDTWQCFDQERKTFPDMVSFKEWFKDEYGSHKRVPMYQDTKDGKTFKTGYVVGFHNRDISHDSKPWIQQDWVSISKITATQGE